MAATLAIVGGGSSGGNEELRQWLENYIKAYPHLSTSVLSRHDHIGFSRTALDAFLKGTYFLSKDAGGLGVNPKTTKLEDKITAYREKVEGTVRNGYKNTFIETRSWHQFQHACKTAIEENVIVVVYAKPGVGKSSCLKQFSIEKMTTMPIQILCSANITTRYFVQKIAREIAVDEKITTAQLEDKIAEKLKRNPRPLFVDQANYLNDKALGSICYLWEKAQIPIVLIGTKDLYELFNTSRLTEDVRTQLSSRVAMHYPLMQLSPEEIKTIVKRVLGSAGTDEVVARIAMLTNGNHRHLDFILPRVSKLIQRNKQEIESGETPLIEIVEKAASRLMIG